MSSAEEGRATGPTAQTPESVTAHGVPGTEVACPSCGARILVDAGQRALRCPFCDAAGVINRPLSSGQPEPVFVLAFRLDRQQAARAVSEWMARRRLAPAGLRGRAAERVTGVYVPAYLYSATARSDYQASIGERYDGREERPDDCIEYRDLSGSHVAYLADVLVTASHGIANREIQAIEPFDLNDLRRHSPALLAGWSVEEPSLSTEECLRLARTEGQTAIGRALQEFMPGERVRDLRHSTVFEEESIDLTLVPLWVFAFRAHPRKPPFRVLVNGQTGKVSGALPLAWGKLAWMVLSVILAAAGLLAALWILAASVR